MCATLLIIYSPIGGQNSQLSRWTSNEYNRPDGMQSSKVQRAEIESKTQQADK